MDFSLTNEQEKMVASVRRFVEEELYPLEDTIERRPIISEEIKPVSYTHLTLPTILLV